MTARAYLATLPAMLENRLKEYTAQLYMADRLLQIETNMAQLYGGQYIRKRLFDILEPPKEETRTPEEVISRIRKRVSEVR